MDPEMNAYRAKHPSLTDAEYCKLTDAQREERHLDGLALDAARRHRTRGVPIPAELQARAVPFVAAAAAEPKAESVDWDAVIAAVQNPPGPHAKDAPRSAAGAQQAPITIQGTQPSPEPPHASTGAQEVCDMAVIARRTADPHRTSEVGSGKPGSSTGTKQASP
jgi:hypothetical protein